MLGQLARSASALTVVGRCRQQRHRLHRCALRCMAAKQVEVSHILLSQENKGLVPKLRKSIAAGEETLAILASEHSQCPSRGNGGSLGWIARGQTVPEFEEAAFGCAPGSLAVCETRFGVHLLTVTAEREAAEVQHMTVQELAELLATRSAGGNEDVQFIDVREEREEQLASLPHFKLLPLSKFESWSTQVHTLLDQEKETVCLCHHGVRSMQASQWLLQQGFTNVKNVTGGIAAMARIDPAVPEY